MRIISGKIMKGQFVIGIDLYNWGSPTNKQEWELGIQLFKWYIGLEFFK